MTKEQYNKYKQIETELVPIKDFLFYCGNKYHEKGVFYFLTKLIIKRQFRIGTRKRKSMDNIEFVVPGDLHNRIIDVIEQYVDEKEKEMEEI